MRHWFTIVLTKGRYVVSEADAETVLCAIEKREPHVLVRADILGDGIVYSPVRIVVSHIISIVANEVQNDEGTIRAVR